MSENKLVDELIGRYPLLEVCRVEIEVGFRLMAECFRLKGKMLVCGNGGSCADSDHIVGELMKSFELLRPIDQQLSRDLVAVSADRGKFLSEKLEKALPVISLNVHAALFSAVVNDKDPNVVFAQQVNGYGSEGDVLLGISTSGNSQNVIDAMITAKAKKMKVVGLTGRDGGEMKKYCDAAIVVPLTRTADIQEYHLPIYHMLCRALEKELFECPKSDCL